MYLNFVIVAIFALAMTPLIKSDVDIDIALNCTSSVMEVTHVSSNGAYQMIDPEYYGKYHRFSFQVNGNAYYEKDGKYGIWRCKDGTRPDPGTPPASGSWSIGLSKYKRANCHDNTRIAKTQATSKYDYECPSDTRLSWSYFNSCAKTFYPVGDSLKVFPQNNTIY